MDRLNALLTEHFSVEVDEMNNGMASDHNEDSDFESARNIVHELYMHREEVFQLYEAQGEYFDISNPSNIVRDTITIRKAEEVEAFVKKMLEENLPPSIQLHISTLQEDIHQAQAIENNMKGIILFFSFVSLIITLLGVYSAITLDTERRQKEVAIRKVNGAGLKQIIILFARTYIYQLVLSATMAFP